MQGIISASSRVCLLLEFFLSGFVRVTLGWEKEGMCEEGLQWESWVVTMKWQSRDFGRKKIQGAMEGQEMKMRNGKGFELRGSKIGKLEKIGRMTCMYGQF